MNARTTKASRRNQIFPSLKAFCRQQSSQPSLVSVAETTTVLGKLLYERYQVVQVLGAGGFSHTYLAKDIHKPSNPTCVVKHFKPASCNPSFLQTAQRLFQTEAEILEKLGHNDQIPQLLAYFEQEQNFYIIQEYIDGQPLRAKIQPGCCWSESQVIQLLQEVLTLLAFIHAHGVIHRDIKPDNLIQRQHDNKLVLIDFGSVKQIRTQTVTPQGHWSATIPIGTQGYMAAEQGQGNPRFNSDLYALGVISVQALTGLMPTQFQLDPDTNEICWRQSAKVSFELASFISKLVSYHFKERYQSAIEALEALKPLTELQSSNLASYSSTQVEAPARQLSTPSTLLSQFPVSEPSQGETPARQLSTFSTLLSPFPVSEPSQKAVFSINSSEQVMESKNRSWIWAGIGTGLASAIALSAGISNLSDRVGDAAKPNSPAQTSASKSDSTTKGTYNQGGATPNNADLSSSQIEKLAQAINKSLAASRLTDLNRTQSAREQPSNPTRNRQVVAARANSPVEQPQLELSREQPSSVSRARQVVATTTNSPVAQPQPTMTEEMAAITKLSAENRRLNRASEALVAKIKVLEAIATTINSSSEKHENKIANHVSAKQPEEVIATATNLSEENQKEPKLLPVTEALFAQQQEQVELSARPPARELATSPDFADVPAQEVEVAALPATQQQEESITTPDDAETEWESRVTATRTRPFTQKQEEAMMTPVNLPARELTTSPDFADVPAQEVETVTIPATQQQEQVALSAHLPARELATSPDFADVPAQEVETVTLPETQQQEESITTPDDAETEWESKVMATRTRPFTQKQEEAMITPVNLPARELTTSPDFADVPAQEVETVTIPATQQQEQVALSAHLPARELATSPDFADVPAQEVETVTLPETQQQEESITTPDDAETEWESKVMATRTRPFTQKQEEQHTQEEAPAPDFVDVATQELEVPLNSHSAQNSQLPNDAKNNNSSVISPDGQYLVGISTNNTIKIWNANTGEVLSTLKGHASKVQSVALSSDGQTLVSVDADNTTKTWNLHTGELLNTSTDGLE